jgi:hypothetical protein
MNNNNKNRNFLAYINNPMSKESIMVIYDANNIKFEKCELYSDFVQSLLRLAFDTYMGDEVTSVEQQTKHFKWCWNKNRDNFFEEGICFEGNKLYEYFLEYMLEVFYSSEKKLIDYTDKTSLKLWYEIFDYNKLKTNSEMDTFIEIYKLMDASLKIV